jgi:hypothetical protein
MAGYLGDRDKIRTITAIINCEDLTASAHADRRFEFCQPPELMDNVRQDGGNSVDLRLRVPLPQAEPYCSHGDIFGDLHGIENMGQLNGI